MSLIPSEEYRLDLYQRALVLVEKYAKEIPRQGKIKQHEADVIVEAMKTAKRVEVANAQGVRAAERGVQVTGNVGQGSEVEGSGDL